MKFDIHVHVQKDTALLLRVLKSLELIITQQGVMMATVAQLSAKVDELQQAIDFEQAQITEALSTLQSTIDELKAELVGAGSVEERQAIADKLDTAISDVTSTITDATPEVEPLEDDAPLGTFDPEADGGVIPFDDEEEEPEV